MNVSTFFAKPLDLKLRKKIYDFLKIENSIKYKKSFGSTAPTEVKRAIKKGEVNDPDSNYEEIRYEGYGPSGTAIIVETLTNNKNRTASNLRTIFQKSGGNLGTQGSASHNFNQLGVIKIDKKEISDEKVFELAIEAGANECISNENFHEIHCEKSEIYNIKNKLESKIQNFISTEIEWIPINSVEVNGEQIESTTKFLETLEDDDDVQHVYTNLKFGSN